MQEDSYHNPLLRNKQALLAWLSQPPAKDFLEWAEGVRQFNQRALESSNEMPKIHRSQGALMLAKEIITMSEMLRVEIKREQDRATLDQRFEVATQNL